MKRKREENTQQIFHQCNLTKQQDGTFRVDNMKGKILQKLISETRFSEIETICFQNHCIDKDTASALIQLGKAKCEEKIEVTPKSIVLKELINEGYKVRSTTKGYIAVGDVQMRESLLMVVPPNQKVEFFKSQQIDKKIESVGMTKGLKEEKNKKNAKNIIDRVSHVAVVDKDVVVFVSVKQSNLLD
ncbi:hypothetical protein EIN_282000 [Entamoeba invadens IP1]|uniref:Uncharacterized protein n=1 Tax=Entamoeba invadens IP1 TaxID=370355 RepID=A0A0A1U2Q7_ENTIV|nr:hypothetical protein EIN_282000 [Entamoeba invadens IP1]ELP85829.1 hypothetical protein EIN_282000 [Entamoeba invadens IP1]|eukprot:XP_004185175.1 hypothetical protein EIN_282000 [Entamoeba invadens IP1]